MYMSDISALIPASDKAMETRDKKFDLYGFSFEQWDDYKRKLWKSWFRIESVEEAVHKILWSEKVMWEFFEDKLGWIYSTEAFEELVRTLWLLPPEEDFDSSDIYFNVWNKWLINIGSYILPPSIESCIIWSKSAQLILSTKRGTKEIVWSLFSYITDFDTAFDREFTAHYSHAREDIREAIIRQQWYLPEEFIVLSSIWVKSEYTDEVSRKTMFRMMREWTWIIKDEWLVDVLWLAELNKWTEGNNGFFLACKRKLWVEELELVDMRGKPISAKNTQKNYHSTMATFNAHASVELVAGWISTIK